MPKVAPYELAVQVAKPTDTGAAMAQWHQLFWLSSFANSKLFELNRGCVRFVQPLVKNSEGQDVLLVGGTKPMQPENSEPSKYGDYLITGSVASSGDNYVMHLELQTTCGRDRVASADVPFKPSSDPEYIQQIAYQAASQLSPLIDKINQFAKEQRESNTSVAYANWGSESITIRPKRTKMAAGQETEVEITMKDCDGYPLPNRRIDLTKGSINGMPILGTTGGTVTPSSIVTDASGKAKVKFKMGDGKTAMIAAHYLFNRPSGCPDAMIGSCPINSVPVKVMVEYSIDDDISFAPKLQLGGVKVDGGEEHSFFTRVYRAVFYHYPSNTPKNLLLLVYPEGKLGMNNVYETEYGFFFYMKDKKETKAKAYLAGQEVLQDTLEKASSETNYGRTKVSHATAFTFTKRNETDPMSFDIEFNFQNEGDDNEIGTGGFPGGVSVTENNRHATIKTRKITDPDSQYATEYTVEMDRDVLELDEMDEASAARLKSMYDSMDYKIEGTEHLKITLLTPF